MFKQDIFEQWLDEEVAKTLKKLQEKETNLTLEDKIILTLKAQTNHFYHLDMELRNEIKINNDKIELLRTEFNQKFENIDKRFENIDKRFENIDKKFESIDQKFDNINSSLKDLYKLMNAQNWKILGAVGLIIVIGKIIDKIPFQ